MKLVTADGVQIDAHHDPGPRDQAFVLAHGFTGAWKKPAVRRAGAVFARHGGVVSFDFRGHGRSGGRSTVGDREIEDLDAAVRWARELGYARIAVIGFSMGASVAVRHAALIRGVDAVAAVSGPARWYYRGTVPMRRVHWVIERPTGRLVSRVVLRTRIARNGWDPVPPAPYEVAAKIAPTPLLVVHGDQDAYFPLEHAHQLFDSAAEPKELWIEHGFGHAENAAPPELLERVAQWVLRSALTQP
ncbi:MAG: alpha/beta fold hydrolase [Hamadaea sp.]|uniref:alpha/beta hydrolase n=1 Tax=Hamadaea sp. TaxID=2024425 RepID=UPI0018061717|nr:alpha/beta fold hydrolase [Hamadaea sp.]NUR74274.1 alpha/beta fold hydrolase [Hamadaea sp.]NUT21536.1 alpha/beta fold hydrolase [Hamadaea sp.]